MNLESYLQSLLDARRQENLYRVRQIHETPQTPVLRLEGKNYFAFCSNDYLGLATHAGIKQALQRGMEKYAVGSGASHLISGHTIAHHHAEEQLARYTHRQSALLFSTGYMANLGVVTALLRRHDDIFIDKLAHASLVDAALLSRATVHRYPHNNMEILERSLAKSTGAHKIIITDGVFSMDGDIANMPIIVQLAKSYGAWILIDDAHGLGVMGNTGRGTLELYGLNEQETPILVGTLGKAFGVFGAFVAGSELLIDTLMQYARSYIYTTAFPAALAEAISRSLAIAEEEEWRRIRLHELITYFRSKAENYGIPLSESYTPIQPIILGAVEKTQAVSKELYHRGILITSIRPPTVPQGTARLRITLSALHTESQLDYLVKNLAEILENVSN